MKFKVEYKCDDGEFAAVVWSTNSDAATSRIRRACRNKNFELLHVDDYIESITEVRTNETPRPTPSPNVKKETGTTQAKGKSATKKAKAQRKA